MFHTPSGGASFDAHADGQDESRDARASCSNEGIPRDFFVVIP